MATPRRPKMNRTLSDAVIHVLLHGWGVAGPRPVDDDDDDEWSEIYWFDADGDAAGRLWRSHEHFLRHEAARRNIAPSFGPGGSMYYGEAVAAEQANSR